MRTSTPYELTDEQWQKVEPILRRRTAKTGRSPKDSRQMLNGIIWVLRSGAPWQSMPARYVSWKTVYNRCRSWSRNGTFERILSALQISRDREGRIHWDQWGTDGSSVEAVRTSGDATIRPLPTRS